MLNSIKKVGKYQKKVYICLRNQLTIKKQRYEKFKK